MIADPTSPRNSDAAYTLLDQCTSSIGRQVTARPTRGEPITGTLAAVSRDAITIDTADGSAVIVFARGLAYLHVAPAGDR
jgi:hypothetical protein